jgi:hypothetical protein
MFITFFGINRIMNFELAPHGHTINQAYYMYVEILKRLREAVSRKMSEIWPNDWILHHDNAPAHKTFSVKQFLAQKSITEMKHPRPLFSPDLTPNDFWLFQKIKSSLKGRRCQDIEDIQGNVTLARKLFHDRNSKNTSKSISIVGLNAYPLKGST